MKLPESVEWLERDYDEYETESESMYAEQHRLLRTFWYRPGKDEVGGPLHRAPMFTFKFCSGGTPYNSSGVGSPPLSLASEHNELEGEDPTEIIVERVLSILDRV